MAGNGAGCPRADVGNVAGVPMAVERMRAGGLCLQALATPVGNPQEGGHYGRHRHSVWL
jgi:hypothetical protein